MKQQQNGPEILGLITKIQEQLAALDKKVDALMMRALVTSPEKQAQANQGQKDHHKNNPMYQVICADCKKDCSVPFKPSGDRPVYCKECFARRRNGLGFKTAVPPAQTVEEVISPLPVKEKKKRAAAKKTAVKKKVASKKKKR